jgi:hypothetical protein
MLCEFVLQLTDSSLGQGFQRGRWGKTVEEIYIYVYFLAIKYICSNYGQINDYSTWINC